MQVNQTPGDVRPDPVHKTQAGVPAVSPQSGEQVVSVPRVDEVNISDAGRAMSEADREHAVLDLDASRVEEIRNKILTGAYNASEVADHVARALLRSGDL